MRESPLAMELDVAGVEDGSYVIETEVLDGTTSIGTATLGVVLQKGLDAKLRALETSAAAATPAVRADILYPVDFIKNINRGRITPGTFNAASEIAAAEAVRGRRQGRQGSVQGQDRRHGAALSARGRQRDHAVPRLRAEGLHRRRGGAAGDCAARPRRERRLVLRLVLETAAAARREARLPDGRAARLPRRRLLRLDDHGLPATPPRGAASNTARRT